MEPTLLIELEKAEARTSPDELGDLVLALEKLNAISPVRRGRCCLELAAGDPRWSELNESFWPSLRLYVDLLQNPASALTPAHGKRLSELELRRRIAGRKLLITLMRETSSNSTPQSGEPDEFHQLDLTLWSLDCEKVLEDATKIELKWCIELEKQRKITAAIELGKGKDRVPPPQYATGYPEIGLGSWRHLQALAKQANRLLKHSGAKLVMNPVMELVPQVTYIKAMALVIGFAGEISQKLKLAGCPGLRAEFSLDLEGTDVQFNPHTGVTLINPRSLTGSPSATADAPCRDRPVDLFHVRAVFSALMREARLAYQEFLLATLAVSQGTVLEPRSWRGLNEQAVERAALWDPSHPTSGIGDIALEQIFALRLQQKRGELSTADAKTVMLHFMHLTGGDDRDHLAHTHLSPAPTLLTTQPDVPQPSAVGRHRRAAGLSGPQKADCRLM